jgi:S1-C subfamily serine protease
MNPYDEIAKMRMVPAEGGGMQLVRIDPDSVLGLVGVKKDDVIKAVNGVQITNLSDATNAVNSMMSGTRFDVRVERSGKPLELKYQVK